jgi:amidohydrolase
MLEKAQAIQDQIVAWRRDFHAHPELSFQEFRTAKEIAKIVSAFGYRVRSGVGKTGVVAEIGSGSPVLAIRADMDALPIHEQSGAEYASQTPGVMHACGHDAHVAIALGAAKLLAEEKFNGTVRFLFQPAEENEDEEGVSGAPRMIQDGAIEGVDAVIALHVDAHTPAGKVTLNDGAASAGADSFRIAIKSTGGHGAFPELTIDPIYLSGHLILALHGIVSRRLNAFDPAVLTVGSIHAGHADNVIPALVEIGGTIRYMSQDAQESIHTEVQKALGVVEALGGEVELRIDKGYPPSYNDERVVKFLHGVAKDLVGGQNIQPPKYHMGAEDFGYFMQHVPGAMLFLGASIEPEDNHHSPTFDIDESCLPLGAALFAEAALRFFNKGLDV